jgi:NADPH:quinone reductase-like Zn-dependent oxidoreductase
MRKAKTATSTFASHPFECSLGGPVQCIRVIDSGTQVIPSEAPQPNPGDGELLIRVRAAGVTPTELTWYPTTHTREGTPRIGAIPGHEFSGVVVAAGREVDSAVVGRDVYGMNDWFADGATAEFCLTQPQWIATKPSTISHELASTVPIGALTAWQGLFDRCNLGSGERVLVHGGSGAVGLFAVQLARNHSAHVIATASAQKSELVKQLGADKVIDYRTSRFEDELEPVDVIFDSVGGETLDRSWKILKPGGRIVTIAAQSESTTDQRVKDAFFIVEPNAKQLERIAQLIEQGDLKTFMSVSVPLSDASRAYLNAVPGASGFGKAVISI